MLAPERRRRSDLIVAAALVVVAAIILGVVWLGSDARGTTSESAKDPLPQATTATAVPATLTESWRARSPLTATPVVTGSAVVAGDGGTVTGLDPRTGSSAWTYRRDAPLCAVTSAWNTALAVFRDGRGCSQVTELDGSTGNRKAQRTSDADSDVSLTDDGTYVTSRGTTRMELWRSDLVRTLEYGRVDAPVNPHGQPRSGCTLVSSASNSSQLAVLEACPGESGLRLTILNPAPKDAQEPEELGSSVIADLTGADGPIGGAAVIVASGDRVALALPAQPTIPGQPGRPARIALFDGTAQPITDFDLPSALTDQASFEGDERVEKAANVFSWWTGTGTVALGLSDLAPKWSLPGALGPGALMAGKLLVPMPGGIAVIDSGSGTAERTISVNRAGYEGPVGISVIGDDIIEQRGDEIIALSS